MALTLGEKLRQAREARGVTVSEVAEQTRISSLYLEGIENDDYRALPGGVFNKGFVKSFAKFVGLDEQEALQDYSKLLAEAGEGNPVQETRTYRPSVLTDDRTRSSIIPTMIFTAIILGLLTWGVISLVNYYNDYQTQSAINRGNLANSNTETNANSNKSGEPVNAAISNVAAGASETGELKVQFSSLSPEGEEAPQMTWVIDGGPKMTDRLAPGVLKDFSPKKNLRVSFWRGFASKIQMKINGQTIAVPQAPADARSQYIEFIVSPENVAQILKAGFASTPEPVATPTVFRSNANIPARVAPQPTPAPKIVTPRPTVIPSPTVIVSPTIRR
jgi:transcriptional regulator with XRE-family HTH domain